MTIVGLGVVTLLQIFSSGLRLQARSMVRNEAMIQGNRVMDELLARKSLAGGDSGKLGANGRWTAQIQTVRDPSSLALSGDWELKEVSVEMVVRDGERERQIDLKTLRLVRKANP